MRSVWWVLRTWIFIKEDQRGANSPPSCDSKSLVINKSEGKGRWRGWSMPLCGQGHVGCRWKAVLVIWKWLWEPSVRSNTERILGFGTKAKYNTVTKQAYNVPSSHAISLQAALQGKNSKELTGSCYHSSGVPSADDKSFSWRKKQG